MKKDINKTTKKENIFNAIIGFWVMISPLFFGKIISYPGANVYIWTFFFAGLAVMVLSIYSFKRMIAWAERLILFSGIWLLLSPLFLIYFNRSEVYFWNSIICGALISFFSAKALPFVENINYHRHIKKEEDFLINLNKKIHH